MFRLEESGDVDNAAGRRGDLGVSSWVSGEEVV